MHAHLFLLTVFLILNVNTTTCNPAPGRSLQVQGQPGLHKLRSASQTAPRLGKGDIHVDNLHQNDYHCFCLFLKYPTEKAREMAQ